MNFFKQLTQTMADPDQPLYVIESITATPRYHLFTWWGVKIEATRYAPFSYLSMLPLALIITLFALPQLAFLAWVGYALAVAFAIWLALTCHSLGHIIGGKLGGSAMDRLLLTSSRQVNIYDGDQEQFPPRVHLARAAGGPVFNILLGGVAWVMTSLIDIGNGFHLVVMIFAISNLIMGIGSLAPIRSLDGETILYYWRKR